MRVSIVLGQKGLYVEEEWRGIVVHEKAWKNQASSALDWNALHSTVSCV